MCRELGKTPHGHIATGREQSIRFDQSAVDRRKGIGGVMLREPDDGAAHVSYPPLHTSITPERRVLLDLQNILIDLRALNI